MAKCVRIYVRQTVTLAELRKPVGDAVRVHGRTVILRKHKALPVVILAQTQYLAALPRPVLFQELHRFDRQRDITLRPLGFRRVLVNSAIGRILDIVADVYARVVKICAALFKTGYFAATRTGDKQHMRKRAPLYGLVFKEAADIGNIFGLKIIDLFMRYLGQRGFTCHVKWHKSFLLGLVEHGGYQTAIVFAESPAPVRLFCPDFKAACRAYSGDLRVCRGASYARWRGICAW